MFRQEQGSLIRFSKHSGGASDQGVAARAVPQLESALEVQDPPLRANAARALARIMRRRTDVSVKRDVIMKAVNFEISLAERLCDVQLALDLPMIDRNAALKLSRGDGATSLLTIIGVIILLMPVLLRTWREYGAPK